MSSSAAGMEEGTGAVAGEVEDAEETVVRRMPVEVSWEMLDKSRFFLLGAVLFSGVSAALYPAVILKTHLQVALPPQAAASAAAAGILCRDGPQGFYRGFGASLAGTVPARALYMAALEPPRAPWAPPPSDSASLSLPLSLQPRPLPVSPPPSPRRSSGPPSTSSTSASWSRPPAATAAASTHSFQKILLANGVRGLSCGFGVSVLTYATSSAAWWASYATSQRLIWRTMDPAHHDNHASVMAVQAASAAAAGGAAALVTMPLDTVKTRLQVMDAGPRPTSLAAAVRAGARGRVACVLPWAQPEVGVHVALRATMVTAYEFLKRLSSKEGRVSLNSD